MFPTADRTTIKLAIDTLLRLAAGRLEARISPLRDDQLALPQAHPLLVIPAKHPEFGDLEVRVEDDIGFQIWFGSFTHAHYEFDGASPEEIERVAREVIAVVERVLVDELVFWTGRFGIGGSYPRGAKPPWKWLRTGPQWVWSGPLSE